MKTTPRISVIIPSYNRGHLILQALKSVSDQTYTNLEIIVVDDGSNDNTTHVVSKYNDPRVVYIKHDNNMGLPSARNTGIKASSGNIIAFLDTDDLWLEHKLEEHINIFDSKRDTYVVYSGSYRYQNRKKTYIPSKFIHPKQGDLLKRLLAGNFVPAISVCIKRECFDKVGLFDPTLLSFEDWDMWIRLAKEYKFHYIPSPLNLIYFTEDSLTAQVTNFLSAEKTLLKKHYDVFCMHPSILAKRYANLGLYHAIEGNRSESFSYLNKAGNLSKSYAILPYLLTIFGVHFFRLLINLYTRSTWLLSKL
jgi:glycosyltransferase involved in cell wall biosynthesis